MRDSCGQSRTLPVVFPDMASVHRKAGSSFWFAFWRGADGKQKSRSTKFSNRSKALKLALEYERTDRRLREGTLAIEQAHRVVVDLARELGMDAPLVPTVRSWFVDWLKEREHHIAEATRYNYDKGIRSLLDHLGGDADRPLPSLTAAKLQAWMNSVATRGLSTGTARTYTEPIKAALLKAWRRGVLQSDPSADLEIPKVRSAEKDAFTQPEIDSLLAAADEEWRLVVLLGAYAGLRLGDATSLTWREVDLACGLLKILQGKTRREVVIPIHPRLRAELEAHAGDDPTAPLCPSLKDRDSRGTHGTSARFKALMLKAGIAFEQRGTGVRKVSSKSAHSLRHTFVRRLMSAGVDESIRMKLAGHASKEAHRTYAKADLDMLRTAVEAMP